MTTPKCGTCGRNPQRMNSDVAECSHCECPHRRGGAWHWNTPPATNTGRGESDPTPLDKDPEFLTT